MTFLISQEKNHIDAVQSEGNLNQSNRKFTEENDNIAIGMSGYELDATCPVVSCRVEPSGI